MPITRKEPVKFMLPCALTGRQNRHVLRFQDPTSSNAHIPQEQQQPSSRVLMSQQASAQQGPPAQNLHMDSIILGVDALRQNPMISLVSNVLASYDTQMENQVLQGKQAYQPNEFMLPCASTGRENRHIFRFQDPTSSNAHGPQEQQPCSHVSAGISSTGRYGRYSTPQHKTYIGTPSFQVSTLSGRTLRIYRYRMFLLPMTPKCKTRFSKQASSRHSGRYNTTDTTNVPPEFHWPNEGYHGAKGKKRAVYHDLTLPQWAVGQLSNIHQIQDPTLLRQTLL